MSPKKISPKDQCDWCKERARGQVYTLFLPGPSSLQILVASCCARAAAQAATRSPVPKVSSRGREVLHLLEAEP
jgi:hypothetical protein